MRSCYFYGMIRISYLLILLALITACGDGQDEQRKQTSPRIRKSTSIDQPAQNQQFVRGEQIPVSILADEGTTIDSVVVTIEDETSQFTNASFQVTMPTRKVGAIRIMIKVYAGNNKETHYRKVIILSENEPEELTYEVVNTIPHDTEDYTQGLLIKDGFLYESTGQRGQSTFKKKNLSTGETVSVVNLPNEAFGEGLAFLNGEFFQLTWTSGTGYVYNEKMEQQRTFNYQMEGWGLTTYGDQLILTDESEKLYFVEPMSFTITKEIQAYDNNGKVGALNELELIDGLIYANVYPENYMVVIDPETGEVVQRIDFTGLLSDSEAADADVLNGIAIDPETNKIYVTGKWWPKLFEVTFQPKTL